MTTETDIFFWLGREPRKVDPTTRDQRTAMRIAAEVYQHAEAAKRDTTTPEDRQAIAEAVEIHAGDVASPEMTAEQEAYFANMHRPGALTRKK